MYIVNLGNTNMCFNSFNANGQSISSGCLDKPLAIYKDIPFDPNGYLAISGPVSDNHIVLKDNADTVIIDCNSVAVLDKNQNVVQYNNTYLTLNGMCY